MQKYIKRIVQYWKNDKKLYNEKRKDERRINLFNKAYKLFNTKYNEYIEK